MTLALCMISSVLLYATYILLSRSIAVDSGALDWIALLLCALLPLLVFDVKKYSVKARLAALAANLIVLFFGAFHLIAFFFEEGL